MKEFKKLINTNLSYGIKVGFQMKRVRVRNLPIVTILLLCFPIPFATPLLPPLTGLEL